MLQTHLLPEDKALAEGFWLSLASNQMPPWMVGLSGKLYSLVVKLPGLRLQVCPSIPQAIHVPFLHRGFFLGKLAPPEVELIHVKHV